MLFAVRQRHMASGGRADRLLRWETGLAVSRHCKGVDTVGDATPKVLEPVGYVPLTFQVHLALRHT